MTQHMKILFSILLVAFAASVWAKPQPSDADKQKMRAASPAKATAMPKKKRKLLIYNRCRGYRHSSIPWGAEALRIMGEKTGAYTVVSTEDPSLLAKDKIGQFDAVCMNNTTGNCFQVEGVDEDAIKKSLLDFVRNGGGLIGIHSATDCYYKWTEYGEMMGGYFWGHPWHEEIGVKIDDPAHPLNAAFEGRGFHVTDEIYQFKAPYSRDKLRVLISMDTARTDMNKGNKIHRTDNDFALAWIHTYGKGRVFYCAFGHRSEIFWTPKLLKFYLAGIQYAFGDLAADATPSSKVPEEYFDKSRLAARAVGIKSFFKRFAGYTFTDRRMADDLRQLVRESHGHAAERSLMVSQLVSVLEGNASEDAKKLACTELYQIGDPVAVPALAKLLNKEKLSAMACYALEGSKGTQAETALVQALPGSNSKLRIKIINVLGRRRSAYVAKVLANELTNRDKTVAEAAFRAIGQAGGTSGLRALLKARSSNVPAADNAILECIIKSSIPKDASSKAIEVILADTSSPSHCRAAAYGIKLDLAGPQSGTLAVAGLKNNDINMARISARFVATTKDEAPARAVGAALATLPDSGKALAIDALAERSQKSALPAITAQLKCDNEDVREAAVRALGMIGSADSVAPLAEAAANARGKVQAAAWRALERLNAPHVGATIVQAIRTSNGAVKEQLIRAAAARKERTAIPAMTELAQSTDRKLARSAIKALGDLVQPADTKAILDLIAKVKSSSDQKTLARYIVAAVRDDEKRDVYVGEACSFLANVTDVDVRSAVYGALGEIASPAGLPTLYGGLSAKADDEKKAAIKSLIAWPTPEPINKLRDVSKTSTNKVHRILALRGYARMLAMPSKRSVSETLAMYAEAIKACTGLDEKRQLVLGLGSVAHPKALEMVKTFLSVPELRGEALAAASKIYSYLDGSSLKMTASNNANKVGNATDGDPSTRWDTGGKMTGKEWFQIDLGYQAEVSGLTLDTSGSGGDYPRKYEIYITDDPKNLGTPVATGKGKKVTKVTFPKKVGRFVRIAQKGTTTGSYWSIHELTIDTGFTKVKAVPIDRSNWKIKASHSGGGCPIKNAIDGNNETRWGSGQAQKGNEWIDIDLGKELEVCKIVLDAGRSRGDYPRKYEVYISNNPKDWGLPMAKGDGKQGPIAITVLPTKGRYVRIKQVGSHSSNWWSIYDLKVLAR